MPELSTSHAHCTRITPHCLREPRIPNPCVSHCLLCSHSTAQQVLSALSVSLSASHPRLTSCLGSDTSKAFQIPCPHQGWPTPAFGGNLLPMRCTEAGQASTCSYGHHRKPGSCRGLAPMSINVPFLSRTGRMRARLVCECNIHTHSHSTRAP